MEDKSVSSSSMNVSGMADHSVQLQVLVEKDDVLSYNQQVEGQESTSAQHPRRPTLPSLQVPDRTLTDPFSNFTRIDNPSPSSTRSGLPPRPHSAKFISSVRNLLPQRSMRVKNSSQDGEKTVLIVPHTPLSDKPPDKPSTSRSFSLNKILFSHSATSSHSLPVTPSANPDARGVDETHANNNSGLPKPKVEQQIRRSFSVPVNIKTSSLRRTDSTRCLIRVISVGSRVMSDDNAAVDISPEIDTVCDDTAEDIPEEEAVCRICFIELGEGGETLKMECSCKGELALAHKECAVKWFSIKGNNTCDICKQDIKNLPVTLLKIQNPPSVARRSGVTIQQREVIRYRVWQDVPILVMVSMLAYFCFLEQLLVSDMGTRALAISLPFSCVLGFISTMIASTMVTKGYMWAYASFQFGIVILFAHIFYTVLNVNAILSVMLSSFTGFGIAISTNSLLVEYMRWRASRRSEQSSSHQRHHQQNHPTSSSSSNELQELSRNDDVAVQRDDESIRQQETRTQNV